MHSPFALTIDWLVFTLPTASARETMEVLEGDWTKAAGQCLLGHKSPIMTQRYAHHYPESLREGVEALEAGRSFSAKLSQSHVWPGETSLSY